MEWHAWQHNGWARAALGHSVIHAVGDLQRLMMKSGSASSNSSQRRPQPVTAAAEAAAANTRRNKRSLVRQFRSSRVQSLIVLTDSKIAPNVSLVFLVLSLVHIVALLPMKQHISRLSKRVPKGPPVRTRGLLGQRLSLCIGL